MVAIIDISHLIPMLWGVSHTPPDKSGYKDYDFGTVNIAGIDIETIKVDGDETVFTEIYPLIPEEILSIIHESVEDMLSNYSKHHQCVEDKSRLVMGCSKLFQEIVDREMLELDRHNAMYNLVPMENYSYTYTLRTYGERILLSLFVDKYIPAKV